ncbi:MAG: hypothetical protein R3B96_17630 [Pirellulaceae bacterium]
MSAVLIRVLGMLGFVPWHERSTIELTVALLVVMGSFALAAWVEYGIGRIAPGQASAALASIGIRTGGVALAVVVTVMSPFRSQSQLLLLASLYVIVLAVDTTVWSLVLRGRSRHVQ